MAMRRYELYHSKAELSYTLVEARADLEDHVLEADAKLVETFVAPSWDSALELGDEIIKGDNHVKEEA